MPPSPAQAAYWQHRGDTAMLHAALWLILAIGCWVWARRFRQRQTPLSRIGTVEEAMPLRGRWLRYFLLVLVGVAALMALGSVFEGFMAWTEAARYRPK